MSSSSHINSSSPSDNSFSPPDKSSSPSIQVQLKDPRRPPCRQPLHESLLPVHQNLSDIVISDQNISHI